jgi:hypothetical protein
MPFYTPVERGAANADLVRGIKGSHAPPAKPAVTRSLILRAALAYARRSIPVFPVEPGGKRPLIRDWPNKATTDPRRIHAWWNRWPKANVGIPTGEANGILALDVDHPPTLEALEAERGELPTTATTGTGNGGMHYLFRYPAGVEIRNSAGRLGKGLDVRGEGGYIVAPPSVTVRPYEWLDRRPLAPPPAWLVETLSEPHRPRTGRGGPRRPAYPPAADDDPIPEGARDNTLTRIAGRLHDGTRRLAELEEKLLTINEARCAPPLPEHQVRKIAASIHRRAPCAAGTPAQGPEAREALAAVEAALWRRAWKGAGGKSARSVMVALIKAARRHGTIISAGIRVQIGTRPLALAAGVSHPTVLKAIRRLREAGVVRPDNASRNGSEAGALVLLTSPRAKFYHSTTQGIAEGTDRPTGKTLRAPFTAPRLRHSAPRFDRVGDEVIRTTIRRLGKGCEEVVDALERAGGTLALGALAIAVGAARPRDLRRRAVARLHEAAVVECDGGTVALAKDWLEALNRRRELDGEIAAYRRDAARYARESEAYRNRRHYRPDPVPQNARADGFIGDLERVEEPAAEPSPTAALTDDELEVLTAIIAYERRFGPFGWNRADCKAMFYRGPVRGRWPTPEVLERIRAVYEELNRVPSVAEGVA